MARSISSDGARRAALLAVAAVLAAAVAAAGRRLRRTGTFPGRDASDGAEEQTFTCRCGAEYRVSGADRHRVYWPVEASASDPVMDDQCVACGAPLPEGRAVTAAQPAG
jgi:hypothetical protein